VKAARDTPRWKWAVLTIAARMPARTIPAIQGLNSRSASRMKTVSRSAPASGGSRRAAKVRAMLEPSSVKGPASSGTGMRAGLGTPPSATRLAGKYGGRAAWGHHLLGPPQQPG
jgi:hypothetical protein